MYAGINLAYPTDGSGIHQSQEFATVTRFFDTLP